MPHDETLTTIKVPRALRQRISRDAASTGQTAAGFVGRLVDRWEREQRLAAVRRVYVETDDEYRAETEAWSATDRDGLDG